MQRPWTNYRISECNERLVKIPGNISCFDPHPYLSLGAPYGEGLDPWRLRVDIVRRLLLAQNYLQLENLNLQLLIFDAWRPVEVQSFMLNHVINQQCLHHGINPSQEKDNLIMQEIVDEVQKFWAPPSLNPATPPPHSTGAAIDLTLATLSGKPLDMGGEIDQIGDISKPDYFSNLQNNVEQSYAFTFNFRRSLLANVMKKAGFIQHPNEWWHFSFGDQMWAWCTKSNEAIYGAYDAVSKSFTD